MDHATVLQRHLHALSGSIGLDDNALDASLAAFAADLHAAVPCALGLQIRLIEDGHPVILTLIASNPRTRTSLRLPLKALGARFDPDSRIILYAAVPGAFVDLAADLSYALHLPIATDRPPHILNDSPPDDQRHGQPRGRSKGRSHGRSDGRCDCQRQGGLERGPCITLDGDLPPSTLRSGLAGLEELSMINRAIGLLIARGHHPDEAGETLRRDAARVHIEPHHYASQILTR